MNKAVLFPIALGMCGLVFSGCLRVVEVSSDPSPAPVSETVSTPLPTEFTASFEIITNGTKRIFTDVKYHQQSSDVFITSTDPKLVHVKKPRVTWNDFFSTLPFSLTRDCLVTGTNQKFCSSDTGQLNFYLNEQSVPDALDLVIVPNDFLKVEYVPK